jgi:long-subunit acyl-CoA synthetase (AMP-forming)
VFATVPRILNRAYGKIMDTVKATGGMKAWLFNRAVATKLHYLTT